MFGAILFISIGVGFIFLRSLYAKFIFSFFAGIPAIRKREDAILRWLRIGTVIAAAGFILFGAVYGFTALSK